MAYVLFVIGAVLIYFGVKLKIPDSGKKIAEETVGGIAGKGFRIYAKVVMIFLGICLVFWGGCTAVVFH